jgi:hypothetical protein
MVKGSEKVWEKGESLWPSLTIDISGVVMDLSSLLPSDGKMFIETKPSMRYSLKDNLG